MLYALRHNADLPSQLLLAGWVVFLLLSFWFFYRKSRWVNASLFLSAVLLAAAFALFCPYLFTWDEQFHALVAKNSAINPLHPKLFPKDVFGQSNYSWAATTTWLHKQPLFTWQMALSIKLFGLSTFAIRLPSVLFHGILVLAVFRTGTIIFSRKTGFVAALLLMHSSYLLGLLSGRIGTDHNDFIFLGYITLSFWALFEWQKSAAKKWLVWIGIFAGLAVLTKWLVGLLVFFGWGITILSKLRKEKFLPLVVPMLISLGICVAVFLPWQIYTFSVFPELARIEMEYNSLHLLEAVEGHIGDNWYHYDALRDLYFHRFLWLFVPALLVFLVRPVKREYKICLLSSIGVIYLFFTIVPTKMPSFTVPVYPFVLLILAFGFQELAGLFRNARFRQVALGMLLLLGINWLLKPRYTLTEYGFIDGTEKQVHRQMYLAQHRFILANRNNGPKRIVFGCMLRGSANIAWMFHTNDLAYTFYPSPEDVKQFRRKGYRIACIQWNHSIPPELLQDKDIEILTYND